MTRKQAAPNGALMRNGVVAIMNYQDFDKALILSESICKLTHADQRCIDSCKIHTTLLIALLKNEPLTLEEIINRSEIQDERTIYYINDFLSESIDNLNLGSNQEVGYTLKAISSALWVYFYAESFESGLIKVMNEGGDAIPERWINGLLLKDKLENRVEVLAKNA